jgi:hypothetical protein
MLAIVSKIWNRAAADAALVCTSAFVVSLLLVGLGDWIGSH